MKREYKMFGHNDTGYCAMMSTRHGWQQVSFWYTTPKRLIRYWATKNGLIYNQNTNRFTEK